MQFNTIRRSSRRHTISSHVMTLLDCFTRHLSATRTTSRRHHKSLQPSPPQPSTPNRNNTNHHATRRRLTSSQSNPSHFSTAKQHTSQHSNPAQLSTAVQFSTVQISTRRHHKTPRSNSTLGDRLNTPFILPLPHTPLSRVAMDRAVGHDRLNIFEVDIAGTQQRKVQLDP